MQTPRDWHLVLIVLLITSIAALVVVGKSISQRGPPMLLRDHEDREGRMVYNTVSTTTKCMLNHH